MRSFSAVAGLFACAVLVHGVPALAVDRTLGADVPKPSPSGAPWTDREVAALSANLDIALAGAGAIRGARIGIEAIDARDGRMLYERDQDGAFQPASTLKLVVGSVALEKLGAAFRFTTQALADGEVADGVLQGTLVVRAGGDPFLRAADFDDLAATLAQRGVHAIRDGVAFDVSRYERPGYSPGWTWGDAPYAYAPVVGALAFEENVLHLTVTPAPLAGTAASVASTPIAAVAPPATVCTFTTAPVIVADVATGAADATESIDLERTPLGCTRAFGTIPLGWKPARLDAAVPFPSVYAALALREALQRHGIAAGASQDGPSVTDERRAPVDGTVLWTHASEPLSEIVGDMWLPSDNLVAEMLARELGVAGGSPPATLARGIAVETAWLRGLGVDTAAITLEDGSGLSTYDRITPHDLVMVLRHDWDGPNRDLVLDDLPIAGVRGTLASSYPGSVVERHVFAKTGSLSHVATLAGYAATKQHGTVIFALMVNDAVGDAKALRAIRERVLAQFVQS